MKTWEKRVLLVCAFLGIAFLAGHGSSAGNAGTVGFTSPNSAPALVKMLVPKKIKLITHFSPSATA